VAEALGRDGMDVWWDQTLRSGEACDEVTGQALRSAKAVVVLWSKASVASRWVRAEATIGDHAGTLLPMRIEHCERPVMFGLRQSADLAGWQGFVDVRTFIGRAPPASSDAGVRNPVPSKPVTSRRWHSIAMQARPGQSPRKPASPCCPSRT
jgi:TIR domain